MSTTERLKQQYGRQVWEGREAFRNEKALDENPYDLNHNLNCFYAWRLGWISRANEHRIP